MVVELKGIPGAVTGLAAMCTLKDLAVCNCRSPRRALSLCQDLADSLRVYWAKT